MTTCSEMGHFYNPDTKVITMPEEDIELYSKGLACLLFEKMKEHSDNIVQILAATGETETSGEVLKKCIRTALTLRKNGIKQGDIISICSHNQLSCVVPFVASLFIGAIPAPVDPSLNKSELIHMLGLVQPREIFVSTDGEKLVEEALNDAGLDTKIVVFGETETNTKFASYLIGGHDENKEFQAYVPKSLTETCIILFSSGTTGLPKGICLPHRYFLYALHQVQCDSNVTYASLYWISTTFSTLSSLACGFKKYVVSHFKPDILWKYLAKYEIEQLFLSPSDSIQFYKARPTKINTSLTLLYVGGGFIANDYLIKYQEMFPDAMIRNTYGQTELFISLEAIDHRIKPCTIGIPIAGRSYKIVDPETYETLGVNQPGELLVKTKWCMNGYYKMDSTDAFDKEGFLRTGDICYYDEDFHFYIVDRAKEMFKYKSWHIVPAKIETILLSHDDVSSAAVVGIPHPEDDNHILAVVSKMPGSEISAEELKQFVESQLDDRHQLRSGLRFIDQMPLTVTGKIRRRYLRDMFINGEV